ncbi:MAG: restriction endonuclease, partial [Terriglobia bacterium]
MGKRSEKSEVRDGLNRWEQAWKRSHEAWKDLPTYIRKKELQHALRAIDAAGRRSTTAESKPFVAELRALVAGDPGNPELRLGAAIKALKSTDHSLRSSFAGIDSDSTDWWESVHYYYQLTPEMTFALEQLRLATAMGLTDLLDAARAKFLLITLVISESAAKHPESPRPELTEAMVVARDLTADTKKILRRRPHSIQALTLQRAAHRLLGNKPAVAKEDYAIKQAKEMMRAGLASNFDRLASPESSSRKPGRPRSGDELEELTKRLLEQMGLRAHLTSKAGDGGIDVVAYSDEPILGGLFIVQCKDWNKP